MASKKVVQALCFLFLVTNQICSSGMDMITRFHIKQSKPSTGAREKDNTSIFGLHPYMYYVFAGVGGMLLLLLIIGIALYR